MAVRRLRTLGVVSTLLMMATTAAVRATETENLNIRVLPAPGKVVIDGKVADWDLTGGIFACGDAENGREKMGVWFHVMYDEENVYLLARWKDQTPMNNPGSTKGDYGFNGDCLQFRVITGDGTPNEQTSHWTSWRDREGLDSIGCDYGKNFDKGGGGDVKKKGVSQTFVLDEDGKGYSQEIVIPWKLLVGKDAAAPKVGEKIRITLEPNFTIGTGGRLTIKDVFKPGTAIDRVFTFSGSACWGVGSLEAKGNVALQPVRLRDGREFVTKMENGVPTINWTGLIKSQELVGFKDLKFTMPDDGFVSLNIYGADGTVARQLLNSTFVAKGAHVIKWDGLTSTSAHVPGKPVAAGEYSWKGIYNTGIGLRLKGWAANAGSAPWTGMTGKEDWGGDHGNPMAVASDGTGVYLGWDGAEGGKALVGVDNNGNVQWRNIRGGIATANPVAADGGTVYAFNNTGQYAARAIYRVDAKSGRYTEWTSIASTDLLMKHLWGDAKDAPQQPDGMVAKFGKVYLSFNSANTVMVVDGKTGLLIKKIEVKNPGDIEVLNEKQIYVLSKGERILTVNTETDEVKTAFDVQRPNDKSWASALALDKDGTVYVGLRGAAHQVYMYAPDGKLLGKIGREGGRATIGPWTPDGLLNIAGLTIDGNGKLWAMEDDGNPKRVSQWDPKTGKLVKEYFGPSSYGGTGGCVNPVDPLLMVGQGAEWKIDPATGKSSCLGTVTRFGMGNARFGFSPKGKLLLATANGGIGGPVDGPTTFYEKMGEGDWKMRSQIRRGEKGKVTVWADANDDAKEQAEEVKEYTVDLGGWITGWYMYMTPDLTFYGSMNQVKVTDWTACGAPVYDFTKTTKLPGPKDAGYRGGMGALHGMGSADNKYMLWNGTYGDDHTTLDCYDIASGKFKWSFPNNYTGVHGSHRAGPPERGLIRGAYDICGSIKLPEPLGNVWVIVTNKGEWHMMNEAGFYVTPLFESNPLNVSWPEKAVPGAIMDSCPPGAGEESFGGAVTLAKDGKVYLSAGHTSFMNIEVVGLDTVKSLAETGKISISSDDVATAKTFREKALSGPSTMRTIVVKQSTPTFTGDLAKDFAGATVAEYKKDDAAGVRTALAWDKSTLYVAWEVNDETPWVNGADAPEFLYARGDTVDLQLGTDLKGDNRRTEEQEGDLRLSIGSFQGKPTAVVYRRVAKEKHPMSFRSGVISEYKVDSVIVLKDAKIEVKVSPDGKKYTVEAAIPLAALDLKPAKGVTYRGDFGVTHGDKAGRDTAIRTYWSNQNTGIVSDEVFELKTDPKAWGELQFAE